MFVPRIPAAAVIAVACLLLQACSESGDGAGETPAETSETASDRPQSNLPPANEPQPVAACSLLTAEQVESVMGHAMDGPAAGPSQGGGRGEGRMSSCSFATRSETENAAPAELLAELGSAWFINVTVWVWPSEGDGALNYMNAMRDAPMTDSPVQEIGELADEAVWNGTLHARRNNITVSLDVRPPKAAETPAEIEKERALMDQALEQL